MAAFQLFLCTIVTTFCFCSLVNGAVVHNLVHADDLANGYNDGINREESYLIFPDSIRARRSTDSDEKLCSGSGPCGWAVYVPFTRSVEYFMRNTCHCPSLHKCVRTEDDLSASAYIYRCRTNISETDIVAPAQS